MNCYLCGTEDKVGVRGYPDSDKYMNLIGANGGRVWYQCPLCGLYYQDNNLKDDDLNEIYLKYRDKEMRGTTVEKEFERIIHMPDSENKTRVIQLSEDEVLMDDFSALDIGSGLGVFPSDISSYLNDVSCIEPNKECADFINEELNIPCYNGFYKSGIFGKKDLVTIIHVLEHMRNPIQFLENIAEDDLKLGGTLYIEVPDADEFDTLPLKHDEFNSTHLYFFNMPTLIMVAERAGLEPYLVRKIRYPERNLSRLYMLCKNQ